MVQKSAVVRYAVVLLVFTAVCVHLFKLRSVLLPGKDLPQNVLYSNISNSRIILSDGRGLLLQHRDNGPKSSFSSTRSLVRDGSMESDTSYLVFAHGNAVKPYESIMAASWVTVLRAVLNRMNSTYKLHATQQQQQQEHISARNQITVVVSNTNYTLSLLNWLVSALIKTTPPLHNVIVISLDKTLYSLLERKQLQSVYVNPETIINGPMHTSSSHIWITRCTVYRLLNHWGYDVMAYDTDAIVLRNLQPILDAHTESDVVASSGTYPFQLGRKWGLTLCMGVILIRSTRNTGEEGING